MGGEGKSVVELVIVKMLKEKDLQGMTSLR